MGTAVGLGVTTAVLLFASMTMVSTWIRVRDRSGFGTGAFAPVVARDVEVWVGQLAPGVKGVLSSEGNDARSDPRQDALLSQGLGLPGGTSLAFYSLVVFNTSSTSVHVALGDGSLVVAAPGGPPEPSKGLHAFFAGASPPSSSQASVLRSLGADRETVDLPPGKMARQTIAFARPLDLSTAVSVVTRDGTAFHRRRIPQKTWAGLLHSPSVEDVENL